jgi:hypothetical protein
MGIFGLKGFLSASEHGLSSGGQYYDSDVGLPHGSTLCIDANGFIFWILETVLGRRGGQFIGREFGGSYDNLQDTILSEISLLQECGLRLLFFFDGYGHNRMKEATSSHRSSSREDQWYSLWDACQRGKLSKLAQADIPVPPLSFLQFEATLSGIDDVEIIRCKHEADQEVARYCYLGNQKLQEELSGSSEDVAANKVCGGCFVYGNDTDFLLMKGCPYIPLGGLVMKRSAVINNDAGSSAVASGASQTWNCVAKQVWHRSLIADALDMTESQLVEWAILAGNDYTGHFEKDLFDLVDDVWTNVSDGPKKEEEEEGADNSISSPIATTARRGNFFDLESCRDYILSQGEDYRLTSSKSQALQEAIEFSRLSYELGDISAYLGTRPESGSSGGSSSDNANANVNANANGAIGDISIDNAEGVEALAEESSSTNTGMSLSAEQKRAISQYYHRILENAPELTEGGAAILTLSFLQDQSQSESELLGFGFITPMHLNAFIAMLTRLHTIGPKASMTALQQPQLQQQLGKAPILLPIWEDICVAHYYQKICQWLITRCRMSRGGNNAPRLLYCGPLFHSIVDTMRREEGTDIGTVADAGVDPTVTENGGTGRKSATATRTAAEKKKKGEMKGYLASSDREDGSSTRTDGREKAKVEAKVVAVAAAVTVKGGDLLPIEEHKEEILATIAKHRVTIIQGRKESIVV